MARRVEYSIDLALRDLGLSEKKDLYPIISPVLAIFMIF